MVALHLVRHARPHQDRARGAEEWTLADGAAVDAGRLRNSGVLPPAALWVSSTEPKAIATSRLLTAAPVELDDQLREAKRSAQWLGQEQFESAVRRSFASPDRAARRGWEPLAITQSRVVEAAGRVWNRDGHRDVVLVGHGTAWTLLVAALTRKPVDVAAWTMMLMPDHCALERPDRPDVAWRIVGHWGDWST